MVSFFTQLYHFVNNDTKIFIMYKTSFVPINKFTLKSNNKLFKKL